MDDAGPCGPGSLTMCGNQCINIKRDVDNCGMCGKACKLGEVCVQGGCALQCGGGATKCNGTCLDIKSDPEACGQCGNKCLPGQVCSVGKCAATCQAGLTDCMGACIDLQADHDNCGMCGSACPDGQLCSAGKCAATCQNGWTTCANDAGGSCVDLQHDPQNCGSCGTACPNGFFCTPNPDGGMPTCGIQCFGGTTLCGNACADTQIDPSHCGDCNTTCNQICSSGHCCNNGEAYCNGSCKPAAQCGVVFSQMFTQNQSSPSQCTAWNTWRSLLVGNYTSITIKGSQDNVGVTCTGGGANTLCQALRNNQSVQVLNCNGRNWQTGQCVAIELSADGDTCSCSSGYIARPCINNLNWGGVNGATCGAVSQTITVICQ